MSLTHFSDSARDYLKNFDFFADIPNMKLFSRLFFLYLVLLFFLQSAFADYAAGTTDGNVNIDVLEKTLYAKTEEEKEFCRAVAEQYSNGTLPVNIYYGVYRKAVKYEKSHRFIYFKTGLEVLCKQQGIELAAMPTQPVEKKTRFWSGFSPPKTSYNPLSFFGGLFRR